MIHVNFDLCMGPAVGYSVSIGDQIKMRFNPILTLLIFMGPGYASHVMGAEKNGQSDRLGIAYLFPSGIAGAPRIESRSNWTAYAVSRENLLQCLLDSFGKTSRNHGNSCRR